MNWEKLFHNRLLLASLFVLVALASCAAGPASTATAQPVADVARVDEDGATSIEPTALASTLQGSSSGELTAAEASGIAYMREEEKLARDVYLKLYEKWELQVFQNIAQSEETHMAAVKELIDRYGLEDPATDQVGTFTNQDLQALYDQLIEQGYRSQADALRVAAAIEEIDILDLQKEMEETDRADIALVYENLARASENHLRAFANNLERREGVVYEAQYVSQAAYDTILESQSRGGRGRQ